MSNKYQVVIALAALWALNIGMAIAEENKELKAHHFTRCHSYLIGAAIVLSLP